VFASFSLHSTAQGKYLSELKSSPSRNSQFAMSHGSIRDFIHRETRETRGAADRIKIDLLSELIMLI
jgi:hypothetical protein